MNRRTILSLLAIIVVTIVTAIAPSHASAQWNSPSCCSYTLDIQNVPDACLPFKVQTYWSNGTSDNNPYFANGIYGNPIPAGPTFCPPAPQFKGVSIDGGVVVGQGQTLRVISPNTGCCFLVSTGLDAGGCVYIKIRPC
jgi:hypothetical protein